MPRTPTSRKETVDRREGSNSSRLRLLGAAPASTFRCKCVGCKKPKSKVARSALIYLIGAPGSRRESATVPGASST